MSKLAMGLIAEGVVELDPMSGHYVVRTQDEDGQTAFLDVQAQLQRYAGEPVRFIMTPMKTVAQLTAMVESGTIDESQVPKLKI